MVKLMTSKTEKLYTIITEIRYCFNTLKSLTEEMHADLDVNASMRAIMEHLTCYGTQTVPEIAKTKNVSRQHVQKIMNALLERNFVKATDNPAHKLSPLYDITKKGRSVFSTIRERENVMLSKVADTMNLEELHQLQTNLQNFSQNLDTKRI